MGIRLVRNVKASSADVGPGQGLGQRGSHLNEQSCLLLHRKETSLLSFDLDLTLLATSLFTISMALACSFIANSTCLVQFYLTTAPLYRRSDSPPYCHNVLLQSDDKAFVTQTEIYITSTSHWRSDKDGVDQSWSDSIFFEESPRTRS